MRHRHIIDESSILRTYILVATYAVGGPGERRLPPAQWTDEVCRPFPAVYEYPVPDYYTVQTESCQSKQRLLNENA